MPLLLTLAACSNLPAGALDPVDCTGLEPAAADLVEAIEGGAELDDELVPPGTAKVVLTLTDGDGQAWYAPPAREDSDIAFAAVSEPYWVTRVKLACAPEAAAFVNFWREDRGGVLEPGDHPVKAVSFDVPDREQSGEEDSFSFEGVVTITAVEDGRASGYLQGRGGGILGSNFTDEPLGLEYTVEALAFNQIPL